MTKCRRANIEMVGRSVWAFDVVTARGALSIHKVQRGEWRVVQRGKWRAAGRIVKTVTTAKEGFAEACRRLSR